MGVRMVGECRSPGVEHGGESDAGTEMLGVGRDEPLLGSGSLAFWAMPIATGVVGDAQVCAVLAAFDMTAQRRCSAALDRRHDLELAEAHMAGMGRTPSRPAVAQDVRHLDRWP